MRTQGEWFREKPGKVVEDRFNSKKTRRLLPFNKDPGFDELRELIDSDYVHQFDRERWLDKWTRDQVRRVLRYERQQVKLRRLAYEFSMIPARIWGFFKRFGE